MTLDILRCHGGLILMTSHLISNGPLQHEWIVIRLATRYKVSCRCSVATDNGDPTTITNQKIILIVLALGRMAVVTLFIPWSGNGDVTIWCTNLDGRSVEIYWLLEALIVLSKRATRPYIYGTNTYSSKCRDSWAPSARIRASPVSPYESWDLSMQQDPILNYKW